jgi:amidase
MSELAFAPALELASLVRTREVSPVDLVGLYLDRIDEHDAKLNAFVTVVGDRALAEARASERALGDEHLLPFHGVPISIKDLHDTAGIRTTYSSKAFADNVPDVDTATVRKLKRAGFILIGKTNAPEFGTLPVTESELNGVCRNPWDPSRTPGGSSGGAAAALAAGLCPISQASDGAGSIRIPASCCGVFGLKPARGRVSHAPHTEVGPGMGTDGPITRTVADAAAMLDLVALEPPIAAPVDPECTAAAAAAAELLEELGHVVEEAEPDWHDELLMADFITMWQLVPILAGDPDPAQIEPLNAGLGQMADQTTSAQLARSQVRLMEVARRTVGFWDDHDLLLTPTLALPPVEVGWLSSDPDPGMQLVKSGFFTPFTPLFNLTGQPAVSIPFLWTGAGLPIGVQLVGGPAAEDVLLSVSAQIEAARPWAGRRPPGFGP